jgi:hypothetical protein
VTIEPAPTCPRHPDVETRLACSACATPICPDCGREAAVGYKCPDCAAHDAGVTSGAQRRPSGLFGARGAAAPGSRGPRAGSGVGPTGAGERLPGSIGVRGTVAGVVSSVLGGLVLGPVLSQGTFFLLSSGVVGWLVARAVFWATEDRSSPYLRAIALTMAGFTVAVGLVVAGVTTAPAGLLFLAYPAAVYGGWIVVRQR